MKLFYVDYENVKDNGLNGITKLEKSDIVTIFYSEDAQRMPFGTHNYCMYTEHTVNSLVIAMI